MRLSLCVCTVALVAGIGCGGSSGTDAGTRTDSGSPQPDSGTGQDAGGGTDAGPRPGGSFATAIPITLNPSGVTGTLVNASTKNYYSVSLTAGARVTAVTQTNAAMNGASVTDTVLTLWNSAQAKVAQDDDGWPRLSTDSSLYYEVPTSGTYYLTVEDCNSAFGGTGCAPAAGITDFNYSVGIFATSQSNFPEIYAAATQDGGAANAQTTVYKQVSGSPLGQYYFTILDGNFRTLTDTDVFKITPPASTFISPGERARSEFFLQPIGTANGDGSTANANVWMTDSTGTVIAAANQTNFRDGDNATNGPLNLSVPVTPGQTYYLYVQNAATASTPTTDYYFAQHFVGSWYYGTAETGGNNTLATAQLLTTPATSTPGNYFVDGDISMPGLADWYEVDIPNGMNTGYLSCQAARHGSGVQGLTATLYDATGTVTLGSIGPETATADLYTQYPGFGLDAGVDAGTVKAYLEVAATGQSPTNTGTSYLCQVNYASQ